ncbi:hypothetical protein H5410_024007 [Solanum commersonii]|uniref:Uncharacterized protein n=1 Tax=Solanum commersonii TaxID=4109 RepID=A0A9J5ZKS3_SOLCO|nr:hypothetical protein H5410_024007 [Solanum commersonii]
MAEITQIVKEMQMSYSVPSTEINANGVVGTILKYSGTFYLIFSRLCDQINWDVLFTSSACLLQDLLMKRVVSFW